MGVFFWVDGVSSSYLDGNVDLLRDTEVIYFCAALYQIRCFYHIINNFTKFRAFIIIICRKRECEPLALHGSALDLF